MTHIELDKNSSPYYNYLNDSFPNESDFYELVQYAKSFYVNYKRTEKEISSKGFYNIQAADHLARLENRGHYCATEFFVNMKYEQLCKKKLEFFVKMKYEQLCKKKLDIDPKKQAIIRGIDEWEQFIMKISC